MTAPDAKPRSLPLDGSGLVVGIINARWNLDIVDRLTAGAVNAVTELGATTFLASVAGTFELPFAASALARSGKVDAIVVVGAVIRGETTHYELVSEGCATGVMRVQLDTGIPIGFGVVTVENHAQAMARSGTEHNVGRDAAIAAMELAILADSLQTARPGLDEN